MIGYTLVGTNDLEKAKGFYDSLFATVGVGRIMEFEGAMCAWGVDMGVPMFGVTKPYNGEAATYGNGTMIALVLDERAKVDTIYAKAIELGGTSEGGPGIRGEDSDGFYAAYFRDLDGNKLCAFKAGPE